MAEPLVHEARQAVLRQIAEAHDRFAVREQELVGEGKYAEAEGAHVIGNWILRAYKAEADDPVPEGLG